MEIGKSRKMFIGTLCALIIGMAVGYAALSQILNINGTTQILADFNIQFTKIDENTMVNAKTITKGGVGTTTANFTVDLEKPGSSAVYDLTVSNLGSIDAVLKSIEGLEESNLSEPLDIKFSLIGIKEGDSLNAGTSHSFQVKVVWDSNASTIPSKSKNLVIKLNYEQKGGTSEEPDPVLPENKGASKYLIDNVLEKDTTNLQDGLYPIGNSGEITTSTSPREYRYLGTNPNNYIAFEVYQEDEKEYRFSYTQNGISMESPGFSTMDECNYGIDWTKGQGGTITKSCEERIKHAAGDSILWRL